MEKHMSNTISKIDIIEEDLTLLKQLGEAI
jgi:hypothetical protein